MCGYRWMCICMCFIAMWHLCCVMLMDCLGTYLHSWGTLQTHLSFARFSHGWHCTDTVVELKTSEKTSHTFTHIFNTFQLIKLCPCKSCSFPLQLSHSEWLYKTCETAGFFWLRWPGEASVALNLSRTLFDFPFRTGQRDSFTDVIGKLPWASGDIWRKLRSITQCFCRQQATLL